MQEASPIIDAEPVLTTGGGSQKTYSFGDAMSQVLLGKKIHKLEWESKEYYGVLDEAMLKIHKKDDKLYPWTISEGDLLGKDYIVLTELN